MAIASSTTVSVGAQKDGRRWVQERFVDDQGVAYDRSWLAEAADDLTAARLAYADQLAANFAQAEADRDLDRIKTDGSQAVVTLVWVTLASLRSALRQAYAVATRQDAIMIGDYLGSLTDNQLQALFGLTAGQVTTLRTNKLTPAASLATSIRAAAGQ